MTSARISSSPVKLLKENQLFKLPVDVEAVVKSLGISLTYAPLEDDVSGFLLVKNGQANIFVNQLHHPNRQRFTIAHEIGHYILHHLSSETPKNEDLFVDKSFHRIYARSDRPVSDSKEAQMEKEANQFAANLLMPTELVKSHIEKNGLALDEEVNVYRLANALGVSERALDIRLNELALA